MPQAFLQIASGILFVLAIATYYGGWRSLSREQRAAFGVPVSLRRMWPLMPSHGRSLVVSSAICLSMALAARIVMLVQGI